MAPSPADSAPSSAANDTASSVAEEAPFETSGNVAFMLTPDELADMLEKHQQQSSPSTPTGLLEVPDRRDREEADDEDAGGDQVELEPHAIHELQEDQDSAWSATDPDPTFEKLALSSTRPARTLDAPGSASIDTAPIRPARRRAPRPAHARPRWRAAVWVSGRRSILAALVLVGLVVSAIVLQGPSRTAATISRPVASSAPALGLTAFRDAFAPIADDLTSISTRTGAPAAHRGSVRHRPTPAGRQHHPVRIGHRTAARTAESTQSVPTRTAPVTVANSPVNDSPITSAPASPPPASSGTSSEHSASGDGSASPPAYGEGGVLGAGHSG
jgi:hypothetical protein